MLTCKQVSKALAKEDYENMSPLRKFFLKFHVSLCAVCGKYNRQVMVMQDTCRCYKEHEEELAAKRAKLDEAHKRRIREALEREAS
jgi:hypothetical protein